MDRVFTLDEWNLREVVEVAITAYNARRAAPQLGHVDAMTAIWPQVVAAADERSLIDELPAAAIPPGPPAPTTAEDVERQLRGARQALDAWNRHFGPGPGLEGTDI